MGTLDLITIRFTIDYFIFINKPFRLEHDKAVICNSGGAEMPPSQLSLLFYARRFSQKLMRIGNQTPKVRVWKSAVYRPKPLYGRNLQTLYKTYWYNIYCTAKLKPATTTLLYCNWNEHKYCNWTEHKIKDKGLKAYDCSPSYPWRMPI